MCASAYVTGLVFNSSLSSLDGKAAFYIFLKSEFCEENIEFWTACEDFRNHKSHKELVSKASSIYEEFIKNEAPKEVTANRCHQSIYCQSQ